MGIVICIIRDGPDNGERNLVLVTNLCNGCSFHFNTDHRWQANKDRLALLGRRNKLISGSDISHMHFRVFYIKISELFFGKELVFFKEECFCGFLECIPLL